MLIVKCPQCKHNQNYDPKAGSLSEKSKKCVYCGKSFKVHSDLKKSRIVKEI